MQNYPNPFNPTTIITFELPTSPHLSLTVCDILGREVSLLVNEKKDAGVHEVKFDAAGLASGVYFYRLVAGSYVDTRKLLPIR
jgi:Secretion system C-terminal sorting domain